MTRRKWKKNVFYFLAGAHTKSGDDMQNSIWSTGFTLPEFPTLERDFHTEVLIVGGGLAGVLCAYQLAQEGVDYALIEADRICRGVSRNTTAKITSQHGLIYDKLLREFGAEKARLYWEANEAALEQYRLLAGKIDCDFETKDNYVYSSTSRKNLERELTALEELGIPAAFAEQLSLPLAAAGAIRFSNQAQLHPLKFVAGIAGGLRIYEHTAAREFVGKQVITDRGTVTASKIIVATHFPILNKHGGYFVKQYQQRSYVLALENAQRLDGMYLDEAQGGLSFRNYGELLLLGGGGHRTGKSGGGWAPLEAFARQNYPQAREMCRWATQDCMSLDGVPYIGPYSRETPQLYVATGFNKWGMTSSMAAAMVLRDLVLGRGNRFAPVFDPSRRSLRPQLLCNGLESAKNLLSFGPPRCPHLGCKLKWNSQEHTWDCPCHGSRFTSDGTLLDNPATGDLRKNPSTGRKE